MLPRVALSTTIHIVGAALGLGLIWLLMGNESSLSASIVQRMINDPNALQQIREESRGHVWLWCIAAVAISFVLSSVWIVLAERTSPLDESQARSQRGSWAGLFVLTVIAFAAVGYFQVVGSGLSAFVNAGSVAIGGIACLVITCAAFYLGAFFGVKRTMRPSVPFASSF